MSKAKEKHRMSNEEIEELMQLKGWSRTDLASELGMTENAVNQWLGTKQRRSPGSAACILMRLWLDAARDEAKGMRARKSPQPA